MNARRAKGLRRTDRKPTALPPPASHDRSAPRGRARARDALDLVGAKDARVALRDERCDDGRLVALAAEQRRRLRAEVGVAPLPEAGEREPELAALLREHVLVARGALAVADTFEDSLVDEPVE